MECSYLVLKSRGVTQRIVLSQSRLVLQYILNIRWIWLKILFHRVRLIQDFLIGDKDLTDPAQLLLNSFTARKGFILRHAREAGCCQFLRQERSHGFWIISNKLGIECVE